MGWACSMYREDERRLQGSVGKPEGKRPLGRPRSRWEDNIKMDLRDLEWGHGLDCFGPGWGQVAGFCECGNEPSGSIKCGEFFD